MALLRVRKPDGEIVEIASLPGKKGEDGKPPVKGVDYFTPEEQAAFVALAKTYTDEKTAPATSETYGMVKVADNVDIARGQTGIYPDEITGMLRIVSATKGAIDGGANPCCCITPANLEYAVKSVCDGYYVKSEIFGDIEAALDGIIAIQGSLIGGGAE